MYSMGPVWTKPCRSLSHSVMALVTLQIAYEEINYAGKGMIIH